MARKTMGTEAYDNVTPVGPEVSSGTTPLASQGVGDIIGAGTANHRLPTQEVNGFKGAPQVNYVYPNSPEASGTYRNVRILPSAKRSPFIEARERTPGVDGNSAGI